MTAPSFISATPTANGTTSPVTTANIAVTNGDILVAYGFMESAAQTLAIATASGSTSAWTLKEDSSFSADASHGYIRMWTATATATGNITVTFTRSGGALVFLGLVKVWRNSGGIGAVNRNNNNISAGAPTISVTTTGANSGLDFGDADWNAVTGTSTFTASNGTPVSDMSDQTHSANYCIYSSHVLDAGAIGAKTMGMSAPTGQRYVCAVAEILGTGGGATLRARSGLQSTDSGFVRLEQARSGLHPIDDGFVA